MNLFGSTPARMEVVWETRDAMGQRNVTGDVVIGDLGNEKMLIVDTGQTQYAVPAKRLLWAKEADSDE